MEALARFIIRQRKVVMFLSLAVSLGAGVMLSQLKVDTDFANYLSPTDPVVMRLKQVGQAFGSTYTGIVLIESQDSFAPEVLRGVDKLTKAYLAQAGVASVISLTNVVDSKKTDMGLEVARLIPAALLDGDSQDFASLRRDILARPRFVNFLVSPDGRFTALYINIAEQSEKGEVARQLRELTNTLWPPSAEGARITFAGEPMLLNYLNHLIVRDMAVLVPLVVLLLVGLLFLSFRSLRGVILPLAAVLMATLVAFGLMALTGTPLTIIAAIMPVVLLSNGSAYGIHMLNFISLNAAANGDAENSEGAVRVALRQVTVPIILSAVTTFIAFMSFVMGVLTIFHSFGIFTAIGIAASLLFALTFVPAAVVGLKPPRNQDQAASAASFLDRPLMAVTRALHAHPHWVLLLTGLTVLAMIPGFARLQVDFDLIGFFAKDSEPRRADAVMTREFGGTMAYMVHAKEPIKDPLVLGELFRLHKHLGPAIQSSLVNSIADVLADMNNSLNGQRAIPATRAGVESLFLLLEGQDQLKQLLTTDSQQALITARLPQKGSTETSHNVAAVDRVLAKTLRPELIALPVDTLAQDKRTDLANLVADLMAEDIVVDLAGEKKSLNDRAALRALLIAAQTDSVDNTMLSPQTRQQVIARYLAA